MYQFVAKNQLIREEYEERLDLVSGRLAEIQASPELEGELGKYFAELSGLLLLEKEIVCLALSGELEKKSAEELKALHDDIYGRAKKEHYENSFLNHSYAVETLGEEKGRLFSALYARVMGIVPDCFQGKMLEVTIYSELMVEIYNLLEDPESTMKELMDCVYYFVHDYSELFMEESVDVMLNPANDYCQSIAMESDLSDTAYLYRYGLHVGANEIASAKYLMTFSDDEIQAMADTYTEGYRIGFETCGKDFSKKKVAEIRYPLGFERMARAAAGNFARLGVSCTFRPNSTPVNKQFSYDHREDEALWLDKGIVDRRLECLHSALEARKDIAPLYGGPAVIETFGDEPFSPESKAINPSYSEKQQKLDVRFRGENMQMVYEYIHGEERSFTIIAYPVASIGEKYEEIFAETVKLNTLDYTLYQGIQQKIIDVLDQADRVHILGCNGNKTDLYVKVWDLKDPAKETAFENCVADVNIPVGEVFTSPVLAGTTGKLHVSQVYLAGLNYLNLEIDFVDGMITEYGCTNFDSAEEGKKYILDNVLKHHKTLPMGEFAIGTNTTAFKMARDYDIAAKLPILIAEKTGPHFAVGDTCYSFDEDNVSYNPDGKAIVARENEVSALRKEDPAKAYFNCHTDITIPYDELGAIVVITKDGKEIDVIRDGRFVIPGTEELNIPLEGFLK